jgi:hypothetical protein
MKFKVTENQRHSDENIPPADGYRRKRIVSTLDLGNWKSQLGLADEPKREFKPGDKIRVNLHHGKIEDAVVRAVVQLSAANPKLQVDVVGLDLTALIDTRQVVE